MSRNVFNFILLPDIEYLFQSRAEQYVVGGTDVGRQGRALPQMDTPLAS